MIPVCIFGLPGSGKTTLQNELVNNHGFKRIVRYTTRKKRKEENDDIDYHYISSDEFLEKIDSDFFAEWETQCPYGQAQWYGTAKADIFDVTKPSVVVLSYDGILRLIQKGIQLDLVSLNPHQYTCICRLLKRGEEVDEIARRIAHDVQEIQGLKYMLHTKDILYLEFENETTKEIADAVAARNKRRHVTWQKQN